MVTPTATSDYPRELAVEPWRTVRRRFAEPINAFGMNVVVFHPLRGVTQHVVESPRIRQFAGYVMRIVLLVGVGPSEIGERFLILAEEIFRRRVRPTGVFPLRFAGQGQTRPPAKRLRVLPAYPHHGVVIFGRHDALSTPVLQVHVIKRVRV